MITIIEPDRVDNLIATYCDVSIPTTYKYEQQEDCIFEIFWAKQKNVAIVQDNGYWYLLEYPTVLSFRQIIQNLGYDITYTVVNWTIVCRDHLLITIRF